MPLLPILFTLIVVGLVLYLAETYIPMDPAIKSILRIFVVIVVLLWLFDILGLFQFLQIARMPPLHH